MRTRIFSSILLTVFTLQATAVLPTYAQEISLDIGFDPNRIIEDEDIFDVKDMTFERMVSFLRSKGTLADYRTTDTDGVPKTVPEIIWRVANSYKINPKYLLALIQKEQSLVEDPNPSASQFDWATGFAVCDNCSKDDPSIQEFKGFASQIEWAAKQHRDKYLMQILMNGQTRAGKAVGKPMVIDGQTVTPANNATAMLYSYTPHIHGNMNLWRIWKRWFSLTYPSGTLVMGTPSKKIYLIKNGEKKPFASRAVMQTMYDATKILTTSDTELAAYPDGSEIRFSKYALLQDPNGRIWLNTGKELRHILNMAAFKKFGFNQDEVEIVEQSDLEGYELGKPITEKTEFPQGVLLKDSITKDTWYIEDGTKYRIPHKIFLTLYFRGRTVKSATTKKLDAYADGGTYQLHDGELVRSSEQPAVYVVEEGALRPIKSSEVFEGLGWQWKNVVTIPGAVIDAYSQGPAVTLDAVPSTHIALQETL